MCKILTHLNIKFYILLNKVYIKQLMNLLKTHNQDNIIVFKFNQVNKIFNKLMMV